MYSRPAGRCVAVFLKDRTRGYVLDERQLDLHQPEWPKNRAGTQYQLLKGHLRGSREFSSAAECASQLAEISSRFRYLDTRDLTGFIDGTENPKGKARAEVALIGSEDAPFAGGSYVFTQRYIHDLTKWAALPLDEQEKVVGRRKRDSKELSDRAKPATAHIARTVIEENGEELKIVRHSFPYGTVSEAGLFFIAYTRTLDIPEKMLARMMGTADDGLSDHLMDFSRAVSGANFFAPSLTVLRAFVKRSR